jgi:hypothetical protein
MGAHKRGADALRRQLILVGLIATGASFLAGILAAYSTAHPPPQGPKILVYSDPDCMCCNKWIQYLRDRGFRVALESGNHMHEFLRIPQELQACHTALVEGYFIEGHVPAEDILRLLAERPAARGLAVPRMPGASPGMESYSNERRPYDVLLVEPSGETRIFAHH